MSIGSGFGSFNWPAGGVYIDPNYTPPSDTTDTTINGLPWSYNATPIISDVPPQVPSELNLVEVGTGYHLYQTPSGNNVYVENGTDASELVVSEIPDNTWVSEGVGNTNSNLFHGIIHDQLGMVMDVNIPEPDHIILTNTPVYNYSTGQTNNTYEERYVLYSNGTGLYNSNELYAAQQTIDTTGIEDISRGRFEGLRARQGYGIILMDDEPSQYTASVTRTFVLDEDQLAQYQGNATRIDDSQMILQEGLTFDELNDFINQFPYGQLPYWIEQIDSSQSGGSTLAKEELGITPDRREYLEGLDVGWQFMAGDPPFVTLDSFDDEYKTAQEIIDLKAAGWHIEPDGYFTDSANGLTYEALQNLLNGENGEFWTYERIETPGQGGGTITESGLTQEELEKYLNSTEYDWTVKHDETIYSPVVPTNTITLTAEEWDAIQNDPDYNPDLYANPRAQSSTSMTDGNVTAAERDRLLAENPNWTFEDVIVQGDGHGDTMHQVAETEAERQQLEADGWTVKSTEYVGNGTIKDFGELSDAEVQALQNNPEYVNVTSKTETVIVDGEAVTETFKIDNKNFGVWSELIDAGDGSDTLTTDIALSTYNEQQYSVNSLFAHPGSLGNDMEVDASTVIDRKDQMYFVGDPEVRDLGGYEDGTADDAGDADVHPDAGFYQVIAGGNDNKFSFAVNQRIQQIDVENDPSKVAATEYGYSLKFEGQQYSVRVDNGVVDVTHPDGTVERIDKGDTFQLPSTGSNPLFKIETASVDYAGYNGAAEDRVKISFTELPDDATYNDLVSKGFSHAEILEKASNQHSVTHGFRIAEDDADEAFGPHSGGVSQPVERTDDGVETWYDSQWTLCKPDEVMTYTTQGHCEETITTWCAEETDPHYTMEKECVDEDVLYKGTLVETVHMYDETEPLYTVCREDETVDVTYNAEFKMPKFDGVLKEERFDAKLYEETELYDIVKYDYLGEVTEDVQINYWTANSTSPIALDLDGDGLKTINNHQFDYDGDGVKETGAWVENDDGVLVYDINGDGVINNLTETFGNVFNGQDYTNGYDALVDFINNHPDESVRHFADDMQLSSDEADALGIQLLVNGELRSLKDANVNYLSLASEGSEYVDANGVQHAAVSYYTQNGNSQQFDAADLWFPYSQIDTVEDGIPEPGVITDGPIRPPVPADEPDKASNEKNLQQSTEMLKFASHLMGSLAMQSYAPAAQEPSRLANPLDMQDIMAMQGLQQLQQPAMNRANMMGNYFSSILMMYMLLSSMQLPWDGSSMESRV